MEEGGRSWELGRKVRSFSMLPDGQNGPAIKAVPNMRVRRHDCRCQGPMQVQTQGGEFFHWSKTFRGLFCIAEPHLYEGRQLRPPGSYFSDWSINPAALLQGTSGTDFPIGSRRIPTWSLPEKGKCPQLLLRGVLWARNGWTGTCLDPTHTCFTSPHLCLMLSAM